VTGTPITPDPAHLCLFAHGIWAARHDLAFVAPTGTLDAALASPSRPYFVSDTGDTPTAGGAGKVDHLL
jgi:microcystin degradation protein MlrC